MPAYYRATIAEFLVADPTALLGHLEVAYASDGFSSQFVAQTRAWASLIPLLQRELQLVAHTRHGANRWSVLLEFPLYRLRRRIDIIILSESTVIVVEAKVGERHFHRTDERQVEEYALDLRDFHEQSGGRIIVPILWATEAASGFIQYCVRQEVVAPVLRAGKVGLADLLSQIPTLAGSSLDAKSWDRSVYRPVPSVIEAATSIFAGHDVRSIAQADASNLREAATRLVELIVEARRQGGRYLVFLTGVPGSGKTLAGLQVVHDAIATGAEQQGDIVYLSGNTPLVTVLREALARDEYSRKPGTKKAVSLQEIRRTSRGRIQHINDFLKQSFQSATNQAPHEHAIVFDEAQRAWDERQGQKKFSRTSSEPALLLELMGRHRDWCACVCLIGGGQEINSGEQGLAGWGEAIRSLDRTAASRWSVFAPPDVFSGGPSTASDSLGDLPPEVALHREAALQLEVPIRSFRSPAVSNWVTEVLKGDSDAAKAIAASLAQYPIFVTRSLDTARDWLRRAARGERRYGLVTSSGARRLRADGLGEVLNATDGNDIAHWYLNPTGDIRSSFALEVPANEYTCQGLELDFVAVCWGGNLLRDPKNARWLYRRLNGTHWQVIAARSRRRFVENAYRVLLTRAREGLVVWVPEGESKDATREPQLLDATAEYFERCGAAVDVARS
jgi:hypothetical protein